MKQKKMQLDGSRRTCGLVVRSCGENLTLLRRNNSITRNELREDTTCIQLRK